MKIRPAVITATLLLGGCGLVTAGQINEMSPAQLAGTPDDQMCRALGARSLITNPAFRDEFARRVLVGDGLTAVGRGPEAAAAADRARAIRATTEQARQNAIYDAMISGGLQMMAPPPARPYVPPAIDCTVMPNGSGRNISCW
jgi:hypothetical protein